MLLREGTNDATSMVADLQEYEHLVVPADTTVLDIGGHIGLFALEMYKRGAFRVVSVEPDEDNAWHHKQNLQNHPQHLLLEAAVTDFDGSTTLYVNKGRNKGRHSVAEFRNSYPTRVASVEFLKLLYWVQPDVLKIDCEGAEYLFNWSPFPNCVRNIAIEYHDLPNTDADRIHDTLGVFGFKQMYLTPEERSYRLAIYTL